MSSRTRRPRRARVEKESWRDHHLVFVAGADLLIEIVYRWIELRLHQQEVEFELAFDIERARAVCRGVHRILRELGVDVAWLRQAGHFPAWRQLDGGFIRMHIREVKIDRVDTRTVLEHVLLATAEQTHRHERALAGHR